MRYLTDTQADQLPSLQDLDDAARAQVLTDAGVVYAYANRARGTLTDSKLRGWGEKNDLGPDRMNAALAFLQDTGRLLTIPDDTHVGQLLGDE